MRPPQLRTRVRWLIGLSLATCVGCLALAVYFGFTARTHAALRAIREMAAQEDDLGREIDAEMRLYDLILHEAANRAPSHDTDQPTPRAPLLELPLTAQYVGFINVLNEIGDVVADPRSNVSRPVNFAGRDYFQDHLKNPADVLMIGRPFATAPTQRASIPISRRLNRPDGSFGGVVVAGVRLSWLGDLLSRPSQGPRTSIIIRRDDGVILMRSPFDADVIGRSSVADSAWQVWVRTGLQPASDDESGITLFRRLDAPLVLELTLAPADLAAVKWSPLLWLVPLMLLQALVVLGLGLMAQRLLRRGDQIDAAALDAAAHRRSQVASMSHELRSPLTAIVGWAEMLTREGGLTDHQMKSLKLLSNAGKYMSVVVDRVTIGARLAKGVETSPRTPCDLDELVHTCVGIAEIQATAKGLDLIVSIDPSAPKRVMLASDKVQQMLNNLLTNAVKFTARGTVTLRVSGDSAHLRFEVADTGPGIPAGKRRRLFGEHDRLDAGPQIPGSGLGLWTTKGLVDAMGGHIGQAENPGGGSVFWIDLPTSLPESAIGERSEELPQTPATESRHLRILLADDLEMTRRVTAAHLLSAGHSVTEVADGEAAVAEVRDGDYDLVVTDMRMPDVDGLETTRRIRALPGHRGHTPVVLLTGDAIALGRASSGQGGVDVCLKKPYIRSELLAAVAAAAELTPTPDASRPDGPAFDDAIFAELKQSLDPATCATYADMTSSRIEDLLVLLERPDAAVNPTVQDAVHDLVGITGLLGLTTLSWLLQKFDTAKDAVPPPAALLEAAAQAVHALRQQRDLLLAAGDNVPG